MTATMTFSSCMNSTYDNITGKATTREGEFEWSREYQGWILSSYFYGYMSTLILGGVLSGKFGS
jgi:hypothetical protein